MILNIVTVVGARCLYWLLIRQLAVDEEIFILLFLVPQSISLCHPFLRLYRILLSLLSAVVDHVRICVINTGVLQCLINYTEYLLDTHHYLSAYRVDFGLVRRHLSFHFAVHHLYTNGIVDSRSILFDRYTVILS